MIKLAGVFGLLMVLAGADTSLAQDNPSTVMAAIADKTIRFGSNTLGPDIEYFAPDGRTFLWRPGRWDIAEGNWTDGTFQLKTATTTGALSKTQVVPMVCFAFPATSYGADARATFGKRQCFPLKEIEAATQEIAEGDVLNLGGGKVPCRVCKADMTFAQLKARRTD